MDPPNKPATHPDLRTSPGESETVKMKKVHRRCASPDECAPPTLGGSPWKRSTGPSGTFTFTLSASKSLPTSKLPICWSKDKAVDSETGQLLQLHSELQVPVGSESDLGCPPAWPGGTPPQTRASGGPGPGCPRSWTRPGFSSWCPTWRKSSHPLHLPRCSKDRETSEMKRCHC